MRLELFEGRSTCCCTAIKRNEVDVRELPVAQITEQYLGYLDLMRDLNLDVVGSTGDGRDLTRQVAPAAPRRSGGGRGGGSARRPVRQLLSTSASARRGVARQRPLLRRDKFTREPSAEGLPPEPEGAPRLR